MKIYTKTGDLGQTALLGGVRVGKDHPRIEAYGTVDELNAALGLCRAAGLPALVDAVLARTQHELFDLGAELAQPAVPAPEKIRITAREIAALEADIDHCEERLTPLRQFILPGGRAGAAALHLARTVCRRAERRVCSLLAPAADGSFDTAAGRAEWLVYLNRLGDLLFVLARTVCNITGEPDVPWIKAEDRTK